jgi:pyrroloquinoline quinone (PQQ) biosynthesis protein C
MALQQTTVGSTTEDIESRLLALRRTSLERITRSPVVEQIMSGKDPEKLYIRYLKNVYHYATHSAVVIGMAGARSVHRSNKVAEYLLHHATEETGHESWAFSDLKDLGLSEKEILESRPTPNCLAMIGMEYYYAAHGNPIALLGWMYTLEALGDDVGHMMAKKLGETLALGQKKGTYFLAGHGDADHDHIKGITTTIIEHVPPADREEMIYVAENSANFYIGLINDAAHG